MLIYKRPKARWAKGYHAVYDSIEEAEKNGITVNLGYPIKLGDWISYDDGKVAQVLVVKESEFYSRPLYTTILNQFYYSKKTKRFYGRKYGIFLAKAAVFREAIDLNEVNSKNTEFVLDWLFRGYSIEQAVKKHYKDILPQVYNMFTHPDKKCIAPVTTTYSEDFYKAFGFVILSGHWFDKLLKTNRLVRDKYMDLVKAFADAGITKEVVALNVKRNMESENPKASIPALKMALDVFTAEEAREHAKSLNPNAKLRNLMAEDAIVVENGGTESHEAGLAKIMLPIEDAQQPVARIENNEELEAFLKEEGITQINDGRPRNG